MVCETPPAPRGNYSLDKRDPYYWVNFFFRVSSMSAEQADHPNRWCLHNVGMLVKGRGSRFLQVRCGAAASLELTEKRPNFLTHRGLDECGLT